MRPTWIMEKSILHALSRMIRLKYCSYRVLNSGIYFALAAVESLLEMQ